MLTARHAERLSDLVDHLAATLATPAVGADPLAPEWVGVPARGTQVWLVEQLVSRIGTKAGETDGIVANIRFGFPGSLATEVLSQTRDASTPDPWALSSTVWVIMALLVEGQGDPALGPVGVAPTSATLYDRARTLADLFDRYNVRREDMIRSWAAGKRIDAAGRPLGAREWQAELWSRLRERIGEPSAAERLPAVLRGLRRGEFGSLDLPSRLTVFGLSVWPQRLLQLMAALAEQRDVHMLSLSPSPALIDAVMAGPHLELLPLRSEDPTLNAARHPLIASWGRPMREAAVTFAAMDLDVPGTFIVGPEAPHGGPPALLAELQRQIRMNEPPAGDFETHPDDRSLSVHSCHGPVRQAEVLYDLLLHLFEDDPTLRPDDVAVLVPRIEQFAPIIEAVFGTSAETGGVHGSRLRYRITDQALQVTNPFAAATRALLELLVARRFEASKVADFLALAPVRHRFALDDDDLRTIAEWMQETNVRWGLTNRSRADWNVASHARGAAMAPNSWGATTDQLLMGAAVPDTPHELVLDAVPTLAVEGADAVLAGHLAEILSIFEGAAIAVESQRTFPQWQQYVHELATEVLAVPLEDRAEQRQLEAVLGALGSGAEVGGPLVIGFADAAAAIIELLEAAPRRAAFRPGAITMTSLPALRSVPHRVVCLLGFDEAAFGSAANDGDDITLLSPRVGDPEPRNDERQMLLEAVLSAGERLIITRTGHDVVRNHEVPEAMPLAELWEAIVASVPKDSRSEPRSQFDFRHTRHGFDRDNFLADSPGPGPRRGSRPAALPRYPFAHDERVLAGARNRAARSVTARRPGLVAVEQPIPVDRAPAVTLAELHRLVRSPVQFFVQSGLQARVPYREDPFTDTLPVEVDPLQGWRNSVGLIEARDRGFDDLVWLEVMQARGALPAGQLARENLVKVDKETQKFQDEVEASGGVANRSVVPVSISVGSQVLTGSVSNVNLNRHQLGRFEYKRAKPHHRLDLWIDLMALTANDADPEWTAALVTRTGGSPLNLEGAVRQTVRGADADERRDTAQRALSKLLDLHHRARAEPLPLFSQPSWAVAVGQMSEDKLLTLWAKEVEDEYVSLAFGGWTWRDLVADPPKGSDPEVTPPQSWRVAHWAHWLWGAVSDSARLDEGVDEVLDLSGASGGMAD